MTQELFLEWLENVVLLICLAYPGPLTGVLVMNDAKIHHGTGILELADRFGVFTLTYHLVSFI
ncbi:hypothetical protein BDR04DRAFT_1101203 [Suillus decipiens]|nr:hypothetical protein BDR04DRAFT_1101203 [Suillus decipiens]